MSDLCTISLDSETGVYKVSGELSLDSVQVVMDETRVLFEQQAEIDIDLADVTRSDSAGLALLVQWMRQAKQDNKTIQFRNLPAQMRAIADATGLEELLPIL